MKYPWLFLLILPFFLNCAKRVSAIPKKIEVFYLSSLNEDLKRENSVVVGVNQLKGIKITYLHFEQPFLATVFERLGFYNLLNEFSIDFLITNAPVYGMNYLSIPETMGYGIKNYEGIRFAILNKNKDSLSIADETKITLLKERSDILLITDNKFLDSSPMKIEFFIKDRALTDTNITQMKIKPDSLLQKKLQAFKNTLNYTLNKRIDIENKRLDEYILSKLTQKEIADLILYPSNLFHKVITTNSITVYEFIANVACELKLKKVEMTKDEILKVKEEKKYNIWGNITKKNSVLLPDEEGKYIFDILFE